MDGITSPKCDTRVSNLFVLYYAEILTIFFKENKKNNNIWKNVSWFFYFQVQSNITQNSEFATFFPEIEIGILKP